MRRTQHHYCDSLVKDAYPESNYEETSSKPKLRDILQNNWPLIFKRVKVMKVKEMYALNWILLP